MCDSISKNLKVSATTFQRFKYGEKQVTLKSKTEKQWLRHYLGKTFDKKKIRDDRDQLPFLISTRRHGLKNSIPFSKNTSHLVLYF